MSSTCSSVLTASADASASAPLWSDEEEGGRRKEEGGRHEEYGTHTRTHTHTHTLALCPMLLAERSHAAAQRGEGRREGEGKEERDLVPDAVGREIEVL